ncbi:class I SAM-dependent methyltransferase [Hyphomicrobium sp. 2TAF46]|uniref:class I SAM-dependent methyltransferase n=1 Tax=Hyphomicrobium sp. 2TAF46 TaxID=3233019 RepID=UPI003F9365BE
MINLQELNRLANSIPVDVGGGSAIEKIGVMAALADRLSLRTFIEIGVYRGRSFFPIAFFLSRREGYSYGIDPYTRFDAQEYDLPEAVVDAVNKFFEETDYDALYTDALRRRDDFRLSQSTEIIRQTSQRAIEYFRDQCITVDIVHIDGNHDTKFVMQDVELYISLLNPGGLLIIDDTNWDSVKPALAYAEQRLTLIYRADTYAVLIKAHLEDSRKNELSKLCSTIEREALRLKDNNEPSSKVSVSIITYNQEAQARLAIKARWKEWRRRLRPFELVIADDAYPHPQSAFRLEEYDAYLKHFKKSVVYTTGRAFTFFREIRSVTDVIRAHESDHRGASGRITILDRNEPVRSRLAYSIFAGNAWENIEYFERNHLPFVFTLYPGGSFYINDTASDERLRRVFGSKMFRRVIVTQKITRDYLLEKNFCPPDKIEFIYGVVTPRINLDGATREHSYFGFGKTTLDICFTAHKYTPDGHDKGYDLFLEVARRLAATLPECRFHVVGGFNAEDLPIDGLEDRITFHGGQTQEWLSRFYQDKDIILLCNVPFVIAPGAFDGFPTGCGSDAMLNGVALFCTDPLKLNLEFEVERDLVIVPHDADVIVERLMWYRNNPAALRNIAEAGKKRALEVYSFESQIKPRIDILKREIGRLRSWL